MWVRRRVVGSEWINVDMNGYGIINDEINAGIVDGFRGYFDGIIDGIVDG